MSYDEKQQMARALHLDSASPQPFTNHTNRLTHEKRNNGIRWRTGHHNH